MHAHTILKFIVVTYQISRCHVPEYCNVNILTFHVGSVKFELQTTAIKVQVLQ